MRVRSLITFVIAILLFPSCSLLKRGKGGKGFSKAGDTTRVMIPEVKQAVKESFGFDYLSYKAGCDYKDDNMEQNFTMNIRFRYDSLIWISINSLGFEVARAKITADSVWILSRLEKKYFIYDYKYLEKVAGTSLSLRQIQNLLTANLVFPPYRYSATSEDRKFRTTEGYIENTVLIDSKHHVSDQWIQHLVEQSSAAVNYSYFKKYGKQHFPGTVDISVTTPKRNIKLVMQNSGVSTAKIDSYPFEIPARYERGN